MAAKKILITEDDNILKDILTNKLTRAGFEVESAVDGEQTLALLRSQPPDLLLLDILLPKKSGIEVLEEMRQDPNLSKIPVIAISNLGDPTEIEKAKRLGVKEFLIKAIFDANEVVKRIAKELGVEPTETEGETRTLQTPTPPPPPPTPPPPSPRPTPEVKPAPPKTETGGNKSVLIIEDDKFLRELAAQKLQKEGFVVYGTTTAPESLQLLEKTKVDVIILDLILPGMDGFEFLKKIRESPKLAAIPVIVLSNLGQAEDIERAKALGVKDYLVKAHFSFSEIIKKIRSVLGIPN